MERRGPERVVEAAREDGIMQVRVIFLDYNGIARARSVSIDNLATVMRRGVNFSTPTVDFNSAETFPPGAAFTLASPDFWALPDPDTYVPAPASMDVGQMYADLVDAGGNPWAGCPRTALRRVVDRAAERGLHFQVGFEPEGYVFQLEDEQVRFAGAAQFATLDGLNTHQPLLDDILTYLSEAGVPVPQWSEEYGPGQIEVNLRHGSPVQTTDNLVTFKLAFRALAEVHGLIGTFMPKPFGDQAGSGLHVHLSCTPGDELERNLFDGDADELGLSLLGRQALAGLLAHGEALTALGATTVNSYKRFVPGSWAPTHVMYAAASRAAFIRIPERETARRIELRIGDPACNPYLYLTGILASALDGIERELDPGPPLPGDVGSMTAETARAMGARPLPHTLDRALDALESDDVMRAALGSPIVDELVKVKRSEWEAFAGHVGAWDRDWYLRRY